MENVKAPGGESARPPRAVVVGRDPELQILGEFAVETVEGGAQVVFVSGEAGIGKSTLVTHFLAELAHTHWGVHVGQCIEYAERAIPFGPIIGLVRSVLADAGDQADEILGHHRGDLAALLPEWRIDGVDGASLTGDVDRLIDAISTVLVRAAEAHPIALFIEDIHWADAPTRDVVASLVHSLREARILVIVSERTGAVPLGHLLRTWLAEQRRFPNVHTVLLAGLSTAALTEQAEHILGETPDPALVAELAERTGGNAYFSSELLQAKRSGGLTLPTSLADFLTSRLERLGTTEQDVLRAMAVAGKDVSHRVLAAALPTIDIGPPLRQLFDTALITVEHGDYHFGHALMREAILRRVLPFEAEQLHRRIAEAMTADSSRGQTLADLATLAMHWAGANDTERSLTALIEACQASAKVAAYESAAELAIDALQRWAIVDNAEQLTGTTRDALTIDASDWLTASDQSEQAGELLADAIDDWATGLPTGRRALLLAKLAPIRFLNGRPGEASSLLTEAVSLVGDEVSPEAAQIHNRSSKLALLNASIRPAMEAADRAIEIATDVGSERVLIEAMCTKALGLGVTVSKEAGIDLVRDARRRAMNTNLVSQTAGTYRTEMMIIYFREGRTQESLDVLRQGSEFAARRCGPSVRLDILHDLALGLVEDGNLVEAAPLLDDLLAHPGQSLRSLVVLQTKALASLLAGDLDEAEVVLTSARKLAIRFAAQEMGFQFRLDAELSRRRGHFETALRAIDAALEVQLSKDNITFIRESIIEKCRLVRTIAAVDAARAAELRPAVEQLVNGFETDNQASTALKDLMRLELELADGKVRAEDAAALATRLAANGFGSDAKQTVLLHAQLLAVQKPDSDQLTEALVELRKLGEASGMSPLCHAADAISESANVSIDLTDVVDLTEAGPSDAPQQSTPGQDAAKEQADATHGLTPREIEVLGFLARGFTNKEIGSELFVSHRTISTHVSNLLAKLHLKNRSEAASKYHELGFSKAET